MIGCPHCGAWLTLGMETTGADYCSECNVYWFADGPALCVGEPDPALAVFLTQWAETAEVVGPVFPASSC